jgi:hypothetical protein
MGILKGLEARKTRNKAIGEQQALLKKWTEV